MKTLDDVNILSKRVTVHSISKSERETNQSSLYLLSSMYTQDTLLHETKKKNHSSFSEKSVR